MTNAEKINWRREIRLFDFYVVFLNREKHQSLFSYRNWAVLCLVSSTSLSMYSLSTIFFSIYSTHDFPLSSFDSTPDFLPWNYLFGFFNSFCSFEKQQIQLSLHHWCFWFLVDQSQWLKNMTWLDMIGAQFDGAVILVFVIILSAT